MQNIDYFFTMWDVLYDKNQETKTTIENFFHTDYTQTINGSTMNRRDYIDHVIEQKNNLCSMRFKLKKHLAHLDEFFVIYEAEGKNIQEEPIEAEIIAYVQFKDKKIFRIHGQVHLLKGNPVDVDMD